MKLNFDRDANRTLVALLGDAETRMVRFGRCQPGDANQVLTAAYIERCADYHMGAAVYLPEEERSAAESFVAQLVGWGMKARFGKHVGKCARQLANHTSLYLPDYETMLEMRFMAFMASSPTLTDIQMSGLVRQAVGTLDRTFALDVVRRELRRLGLDKGRLLIPDDVYELRIGQRSVHRITG